MKRLLFIAVAVSLFVGGSLFAYPNEKVVLHGRVEFGPFLNCVVKNNTGYPVVVERYKYKIDFTDPYGYIRTNTEKFNCHHGCYINPRTYRKFSGIRNFQNILRASCKAVAFYY